MNYREAQALAKLVVAAAPWAEDVYVLPLHPAEQPFPRGPYMVSLSSAFLQAECFSPGDWAEMVRQLEPTTGPTGLPLLDQRLFEGWVRSQLDRTDLDERTQRCSTKDMSLFAHRPYLNTLCVEVPFTATIAPAVESGQSTPQSAPVGAETMLTVRWTCPGCSRPLALSRQLPTWLDVRISLPGPLHSAADTEAVCLADVWVILEGEEQEGASDAEIPFSIQVWQVVRRADAIDAPGGGLQDSAGE